MRIDDRSGVAASPSRDGAAIALSLTEPEAFAEVFDSHFASVHAYLARRAGRGCADDLASRTFLVAFERRAHYRDRLGTARPWLLGIATNLLREHFRGERRLLATAAQAVNEAAVADGLATLPGEGGDPGIAAALLKLDAGRRDALLLHVWGELSYAEIAQAMSIPVGTVRSRISRACASLRSDLRGPLATVGAGENPREDR